MSYIIDRRLNSKNKSTVNRQRFLRRYRKHIQKAVSDAVGQRSITDIDKGEQISIPSKDISEPIFHHGKGGRNSNVLPGNKEFVRGDRIPRPPGGEGGSGSGSGASDQGEGIDDFVFQITQEEFLDFMFEDLELPNLVKRQLAGNEEFKMRRAGIASEGNPGQLNIVRSLRSANARRIALTSGKRKKLKELEAELEKEEKLDPALRNHLHITALQEEIEALRNRINRVPWLDTFDLKYNLHVKDPVPRSKAVMFCLMDVSGSMNQATKDIAKRFFILLYLFLQRNYEHTEVVFIRHHTSAKEVDEQEFFYSRETGGTIVSSALKLMKEILDERYPLSEWNVYGAQASDGDNWNDDSSTCSRILMQDLLPKLQYYSYIEITPRDHQALWREYQEVQANHGDVFAMQQIVEVSDIYPVFRELFQKRTVPTS
ncbi:YeaH/YhbH family protein [Pseudomaricurvus sp.]|uniref:YeaH/YhbH family protein n=1 Tax=Pseudomaricurvus sp. TaxID=2004510 RepID=UPI003F6C827F